MDRAPEDKKKTYSFPSLTTLTPEQAIALVRKKTSLTDENALDLLGSLRRQRVDKQKRRPSANGSNRNQSRPAS